MAFLVGGGALAGVGAHRISHAGTATDASSFAELEANPNGTPMLPRNPVRGPVSTSYVEVVRANEREAMEYASQMSQLNLGTLNSPYLLAQSPVLLRDCSAIPKLAAVSASLDSRRQARSNILLGKIEAAELPSEIRTGIGAIAAADRFVIEEWGPQEQTMLSATHALCTLLAKRSWSNDRGYFGFRNAADRTSFDAINARRRAVESERTRIRNQWKLRFEEGRDRVRQALS